MNTLKINIANDFSRYPGGRKISQGQYSGEEFLNTLLKPKFEEALSNGTKVVILLDGTEGYGSSFLEEVFGGIVRNYPEVDINKFLEYITNDKFLEQEIKEYIDDAQKQI